MRDLCGLEGDGLAIYLPCATLKDEAIQVRQRLGEREASSMEGQSARLGG